MACEANLGQERSHASPEANPLGEKHSQASPEAIPDRKT
mgnify:CR=1 FL=1